MTKVSVCIDIEEEKFRAYEHEAERRGVSVENLLTSCLQRMFEEQDERLRDEEESHPIHTN